MSSSSVLGSPDARAIPSRPIHKIKHKGLLKEEKLFQPSTGFGTERRWPETITVETDPMIMNTMQLIDFRRQIEGRVNEKKTFIKKKSFKLKVPFEKLPPMPSIEACVLERMRPEDLVKLEIERPISSSSDKLRKKGRESDFVRGIGTPPPPISGLVSHQILRKCVIALCGHIGFRDITESALATFTDVADEFFTHVCKLLRINVDRYETIRHIGSIDALEQTFHDLNGSSMLDLASFYEERVIGYHSRTALTCKTLVQTYDHLEHVAKRVLTNEKYENRRLKLEKTNTPILDLDEESLDSAVALAAKERTMVTRSKGLTRSVEEKKEEPPTPDPEPKVENPDPLNEEENDGSSSESGGSGGSKGSSESGTSSSSEGVVEEEEEEGSSANTDTLSELEKQKERYISRRRLEQMFEEGDENLADYMEEIEKYELFPDPLEESSHESSPSDERESKEEKSGAQMRPKRFVTDSPVPEITEQSMDVPSTSKNGSKGPRKRPVQKKKRTESSDSVMSQSETEPSFTAEVLKVETLSSTTKEEEQPSKIKPLAEEASTSVISIKDEDSRSSINVVSVEELADDSVPTTSSNLTKSEKGSKKRAPLPPKKKLPESFICGVLEEDALSPMPADKQPSTDVQAPSGVITAEKKPVKKRPQQKRKQPSPLAASEGEEVQALDLATGASSEAPSPVSPSTREQTKKKMRKRR